jgi:hypothetical protein
LLGGENNKGRNNIFDRESKELKKCTPV